MKLSNKTALITGSSIGFGKAVAEAFLESGANVMLNARNREQLEKTYQELSKRFGSERVERLAADVSDVPAVEELVRATIQRFGGLHTLIANAGIYGPKGPLEENPWDEWVKAVQVNLLGVVASVRAVVPHLKKQRFGHILVLSGGGATKPMPNFSSYAATKAAVVRFSETMAEELKDWNVSVNSIAPGALNTRLLDEVLAAGPELVGEKFFANSLKQKEQGGAETRKGAELCVYLAEREDNKITGKLISAIWDDWPHFEKNAEELQKSEVYTLRRLVPEHLRSPH